MKKILLISQLLLFTVAAFAQNYSGQVVDAKTQLPLSYVHIGILEKNMGTISDEEGNFQVNLSGTQPSDVLRFSMLGYDDFELEVAKANAETIKKIALRPSSFVLPTVPVTASREVETENFGFDKVTKTTYGWSGYDQRGTEIAMPIRGIRDQLLHEFNFHLRFNMYKSVLFRLNIYSIKDGKPHESVLRENIFFTIGKNKKWITVNLRPYQLVIHEDVIVSVEPIETEGKKQGLFFSYAEENDGTKVFIRESSQSSWTQIADRPFAFYLTAEK